MLSGRVAVEVEGCGSVVLCCMVNYKCTMFKWYKWGRSWLDGCGLGVGGGGKLIYPRVCVWGGGKEKGKNFFSI